MRRQCERQVGVRPTFMYNSVVVPVAVICPCFAEPDSKWCAAHQPKVVPPEGVEPSRRSPGTRS